MLHLCNLESEATFVIELAYYSGNISGTISAVTVHNFVQQNECTYPSYISI